MGCVPRLFVCLTLVVAVSILNGCGGGSSGGGGGTLQQSPDFTLSLSTSSLDITSGATGSISASVAGSNGFDSAVTLQISGLPAGVTATPASMQVSPGSPLTITLAALAVQPGTSTVNITGTSGSLTHGAQLTLTLAGAPVSVDISRTRYTRTDAATEYPFELNQNWMVYDSITNRFFVSDPSGNRIEVLDAAKEIEIATIPVPGAYGIDESPDHSVLYAGTQIGDVYAINPVSMQVTKRYLAAQIGSTGFHAYSARVLYNGKLALLGSQGGLTGGGGHLAVWNPSDNSINIYGGSSPLCVGNIGAFTVTGDRSLIVIGSADSDGTLCTLNPATGQQNSVSGARTFLYSVAPTPDGKSLLVSAYGGTAGEVAVYNSQTLAVTATFSVAGDTSSAASMIVSPDSQTLYMGDGSGVLYAYNIATGKEIGWMPNLTVEPISGGLAVGPIGNLNLQAFDDTGLLAGPMEEGVGFLDTTTLKSGPTGSEFLNGYVVPATGPSAGGTAVQFEDLASSAKIISAYFKGNHATTVSQASGEFNATTPPGNAGPVDLYAFMADGGTLIAPEAFSYGPTILEVTPGAATAEGGGTGIVYGYGFGSTEDNSPIPDDLKITVGGKSVPVTGYAPNAYYQLSPPFNLQAAAYTIPRGDASTSADVTVSTPSGTATATGAVQYLAAVQQFALSGAQLVQGIYDAHRDVYYFTDASEIRVFSRSQGQWLSSIQVPAPPTGTTHRLWGIALSPNGSKLAVSDPGASVIYLINPDLPSSAQSFPVTTIYVTGTPVFLEGITSHPAGLAISDSGDIYFGAFTTGGEGYDGFFKLNTSSGNVKDYAIGSSGDLGRVALTSDNSKAFAATDGVVFSIDTATNAISFASDGPTCCYQDFDVTLSADQTTLEATDFSYDTNLNGESYLVLNDRNALNITYVYGTELSPDGTLLFQPYTNGIDVFDSRLGMLRTRISLPFALSQNFDALVSDGTDNILIAITGPTGNGIAVVDLSSLAEPAPLPYMRAQGHPDNPFLQVSGATASRPQLHHSSSTQSGHQVPIRMMKYAVNGFSLHKDGTVTLSKPTNPTP
jgi:WD40 repeat protein